MKIIKDEIATLKRGRRVTVELQHGEKLIAIKEESFYRLGEQLNDVVHGGIISESAEVAWCSITQEWIA